MLTRNILARVTKSSLFLTKASGFPRGLSQIGVRNFSVTADMSSNTKPKEKEEEHIKRSYYWITPEAEKLIAKAYATHANLAADATPVDKSGTDYPLKAFPPSLAATKEELESIGTPAHFKPKTIHDKIALRIIYVLEEIMHLFFREKYDHHAVTLETVAAVPGMVAAAQRHFRSLRTLKRDHSWINPLQEEAENERMHLLIWMQHVQPNMVERMFVIVAQVAYVTFYTGLYALSPKIAHRTTGYLEEAAHRAYTDFLQAIDAGKIKNVPAMKIAKKYYRLEDDATLRDVVLHVRGDECMHRDYNHHLANLHFEKHPDFEPTKMKMH